MLNVLILLNTALYEARRAVQPTATLQRLSSLVNCTVRYVLRLLVVWISDYKPLFTPRQ